MLPDVLVVSIALWCMRCDAFVGFWVASPALVLSLDWVEPAAGATADVLSFDDIGAVSWGALIEELFGAVTSGLGVAAGAVVAGLADWAKTGLAKAISATEAAVIINLFMD